MWENFWAMISLIYYYYIIFLFNFYFTHFNLVYIEIVEWLVEENKRERERKIKAWVNCMAELLTSDEFFNTNSNASFFLRVCICRVGWKESILCAWRSMKVSFGFQGKSIHFHFSWIARFVKRFHPPCILYNSLQQQLQQWRKKKGNSALFYFNRKAVLYQKKKKNIRWKVLCHENCSEIYLLWSVYK